MEEIKSIIDLNIYLESIKNYKVNVVCNRNSDDYEVTITAYSEHPNNEDMIHIKTIHSSKYISIHIDSNKFTEAYNNLNEEDKLPSQLNIINPCTKENYMSYMVESKYLEIMKKLKIFNGINDEYVSIAKLAKLARGYVLCKPLGF